MIRTAKHVLLFVAMLLSLALVGRTSAAAGTVRIFPADVPEVGGRWVIKTTITIPTDPPGGFSQTMRFSFAKHVIYERAVVKKGQPPVLNKVVRKPPDEHVETFEVNFSDTLGRPTRVSNYSFAIRRDTASTTSFFESGEFEVQVFGSDGAKLGTPQRLVLQGDNPVVDRTGLDFSDRNVEKIAREKADAGAQEAPVAPINLSLIHI